MNHDTRPFGLLDDGTEIAAYTLGTPEGLQAEILGYGGTLRRLSLPARGTRRELVLSLPDLGAYVRDRAYLGVLVGRVANRIAAARYEYAGRVHRLAANENG